MAKPILVVKIPHETFENKEDGNELGSILIKRFKILTNYEYHVILYFSDEKNIDPKFEVFNSENATELNIDELQQNILNIINK